MLVDEPGPCCGYHPIYFYTFRTLSPSVCVLLMLAQIVYDLCQHPIRVHLIRITPFFIQAPLTPLQSSMSYVREAYPVDGAMGITLNVFTHYPHFTAVYCQRYAYRAAFVCLYRWEK